MLSKKTGLTKVVTKKPVNKHFLEELLGPFEDCVIKEKIDLYLFEALDSYDQSAVWIVFKSENKQHKVSIKVTKEEIAKCNLLPEVIAANKAEHQYPQFLVHLMPKWGDLKLLNSKESNWDWPSLATPMATTSNKASNKKRGFKIDDPDDFIYL